MVEPRSVFVTPLYVIKSTRTRPGLNYAVDAPQPTVRSAANMVGR
jgi:hypothetical protein